MSDKRMVMIVGHYGSGKTEFAVNYALNLSKENKKVALVDLDIANPYFRSREKQALLLSHHISLYSNTLGYDISQDLPAITAQINAPLQDKDCHTVLDVGGDSCGAKVLNQFKRNFTDTGQYDIFCLINKNRPATQNVEGVNHHISSIEEEIGLSITGLISNTHMIKETTVSDIAKGCMLCEEISQKRRIPIKYVCCTTNMLSLVKNAFSDDPDFNKYLKLLFPIDLKMRADWLDQ